VELERAQVEITEEREPLAGVDRRAGRGARGIGEPAAKLRVCREERETVGERFGVASRDDERRVGSARRRLGGDDGDACRLCVQNRSRRSSDDRGTQERVGPLEVLDQIAVIRLEDLHQLLEPELMARERDRVRELAAADDPVAAGDASVRQERDGVERVLIALGPREGPDPEDPERAAVPHGHRSPSEQCLVVARRDHDRGTVAESPPVEQRGQGVALEVDAV
jgi:hypothetical protein